MAAREPEPMVTYGSLSVLPCAVNSEQSNTSRINSSYDEICSDVSLVSEEVLLEHSHTGDHSGFAASGEGVQF